MRTRAQADHAVVDVPWLASTYGFPESGLQTLIDAPTAELIKDFLLTVTEKGEEYETLKAEKLKVDVELNNVVRTSESKLKAQKTANAKHRKEIEELRTKLSEAESAREALASELDNLRSSTSGSSAETQTLRQRIETLEASNRDTLALVERKSAEKDRVATELAEQHGKLLALRGEVSRLEERNQVLENATASQKFKEQSLQQEIELIKKNNEWYATELQTRTQEHSTFRKERNARMASLQRELDDATAAVETLKRTETTLRQRLDVVQGKADEAFARIASLEEDMTRKEQSWKAELDGSKRLAELQAQNAATHRARLQEVQGQMDRLNEDVAEEIGRLQADVETERADKVAAESKLAELELQVQRLEQQPRPSRPQTPMNNGQFDAATPGRAGSPFGLTASSRKFGSKLPFTNTEYWTKYNELQQDLEAERRRTEKLSAAVDDMVNELENRAPEYLEMRKAHEELEQQVLDMSRLLEEANGNRDSALKKAAQARSEVEAKIREGEILRQQLRDLAAQVKILTVEVQCKEQGLDGMSADEKYRLELMARGELEDFQADNETATNQLISQRLVIFHDVAQLQEQNQQLRQSLRNLGEQMEGSEARRKAAESEANAAEVEELRQQVARYKDEVQSTATQIDSYIKERDMFRRMLQRRGDIPAGADLQSMFGQSVPPATPQRNGMDGGPQTPRSKDVEDLNKILKEQQTFFDQYRTESSQDRKILKDQVDALSHEKSALQAELAHWKSQKTLADERLQMLQANYHGLRNENAELQKRSNQLAESAAKQDLKTQQVAEELVEQRSMVESLRHENANAKAEKELWKRIEARLTEDNKALIDERTRLNKLVTDLQNLQNERELSDSESRRRLQSRVESLETELTDAKKKLEQEVEDARQAALRREYQEGQSRTRIDDLVKSLGNIREELVAATTARDQLQARVDEMKIELRSAEERAAALQPRPTPRAEPQQNGQHDEDDELTTEQRQALEIADLRRDLQLARNELESARQQVEQYKAIAQGAEEELANFNETSEQYKEDVDRQISEKDARIVELQQRIDDLLSELTTTNNELSEIRSKQEDSDRVFNEQKARFEGEISRLQDDAERHAEEKKLYQEDLKAQAEIAQQAQQSYEDELVRHAEAAKSLKAVRDEYNALRTEFTGVRAEAEAAKASLERGEESWAEQRDRFERELEDLKKRRQDTDEQNKLLHQQMEAFSSELAALRTGRNLPSRGAEEQQADAPSGVDKMQEVISYLRREKEIIDVQYEMKMQEAKRLQEQLDYTTAQLEETRQTLADERRQAAEKTASEGSTTKLMQTINELNLFRESSTTLRNEARQAREKLEEKSKEVERLYAELEPLKGRVSELEDKLEGKDGELKLLQDDRDHWRERTQNIISKYDRADPAVVEDLKTQVAALEEEKARLEAEQAPLREQVDGIDAKIQEAVKRYEETLERFKVQAKDQNRKQNARIKEVDDAMAKRNDEFAALQKELEEAREKLADAEKNAAAAGSGRAEPDEVASADLEAVQARATQAEEKASQAEANAAEQAARAVALDGEVTALRSRVAELESQVDTLTNQLDRAMLGSDDEEGEINSSTETLDKLRQDLATAQQEVEALRAHAANTVVQPASNAEPAEGEKSVAAQVAEEVARLRSEMEHQHELAKQQMEETHKQRIEGVKNSFKAHMATERDRIRTEVASEHAAELQKLRDEHEAAIAKLKEEHQAELEKLAKEGSAAVAKAEGGETATQELNLDAVSEDQFYDAIKTHERAKKLFVNNLAKRVAAETEKLNNAIAEKDKEIVELKEAVESKDSVGAKEATESKDAPAPALVSDEEKAELQRKIEALETEKEELTKKAASAEEMKKEALKARVQISQLGVAQAKIRVVETAAKETPEKPVKDVWEVAKVAKPPPKPTPASTATPSQNSAAVPHSPTVQGSATAQPAAANSPARADQMTEEQKLLQRQQRFGTGVAASGGATTFGQPSQAPNAGALTQPPRRASMSANNAAGTNPAAPSFTPSADRPSIGTGPAALRGTLSNGGRGGIPRGGAATTGRGGIQIQGAANAQQQSGIPAGPSNRGGTQSGIPRGGTSAGAQRSGRGGIPRGGGSTGQGQKRPHDGGGDGSDGGKRMRGPGPGSS